MKIEYVGFIQEHDRIVEAIAFEDAKRGGSEFPTERVLQFLDQGQFFFGWMGLFTDLETQVWTAPDAYFTDGVWAWPAYFPHYLRKYPRLQFDRRFVAYLEEQDFEFILKGDFPAHGNLIQRAFVEKLKAKD